MKHRASSGSTPSSGTILFKALILIEIINHLDYEIKGTFRHSNNLPGEDQWWLVVDFDRDIILYYKSIIERGLFKTVSLNSPRHGSHITVIKRGEEPLKNKQHWGFFNDMETTIKVKSLYVMPLGDESKNRIYCLGLEGTDLTYSRRFYGMDERYPFHMTIGWF